MQIQSLRDAWRWAGLDRRSVGAEAETTRDDREVHAQVSQHHTVNLDSLAELYDAHAARAYGLALRILRGDRGAAEDMVAETLVAVWQSDTRAREAKTLDLEIMLLRRIRQRCIDVVRNRPDAVSIEEAECLSPGSHLCALPDGVAVTSETVRTALDTLSHEQRMCIEQAFFRGRTSTQIAKDLSIPKSSVHQAMQCGLRALANRSSSTRTEAMLPDSSPVISPGARLGGTSSLPGTHFPGRDSCSDAPVLDRASG